MPRPIVLTSPYPTTEEVAKRLGAPREVVEAVKAMADQICRGAPGYPLPRLSPKGSAAALIRCPKRQR